MVMRVFPVAGITAPRLPLEKSYAFFIKYDSRVDCSTPVPFWRGSLCDNLVVLGMRSDPKPAHVTLNLDSKRSVMRAHAHRPELADLLEVERRVPGIRFEKFVVLVGQITDIGRERAI